MKVRKLLEVIFIDNVCIFNEQRLSHVDTGVDVEKLYCGPLCRVPRDILRKTY